MHIVEYHSPSLNSTLGICKATSNSCVRENCWKGVVVMVGGGGGVEAGAVEGRGRS